mgnify:CR=1 FL=1
MYLILSILICIGFFILFLTHIAEDEDHEPSDYLILFRWFYYASFVVAGIYTYNTDGGFKDFVTSFGFTFVGIIGLIIYALASAAGGNSGGDSSSSRNEGNDSVDYVPQRMGGTGVWLNVGNSFSNVGAAISSAEYSKKRNPKDPHRVAERRNGKIVGTVYSC